MTHDSIVPRSGRYHSLGKPFHRALTRKTSQQANLPLAQTLAIFLPKQFKSIAVGWQMGCRDHDSRVGVVQATKGGAGRCRGNARVQDLHISDGFDTPGKRVGQAHAVTSWILSQGDADGCCCCCCVELFVSLLLIGQDQLCQSVSQTVSGKRRQWSVGSRILPGNLVGHGRNFANQFVLQEAASNVGGRSFSCELMQGS
mmetsp:Transcript_5652/g.11723  ORF Transcript_5652/g.11723 Transcript_5652/m.11723 type:complete len:200 (+) Transcript_5652:1343-1942(+)